MDRRLRDFLIGGVAGAIGVTILLLSMFLIPETPPGPFNVF